MSEPLRSEQPDLWERAAEYGRRERYDDEHGPLPQTFEAFCGALAAFASECVEAEREKALHAIGEHAKIANDALEENARLRQDSSECAMAFGLDGWEFGFKDVGDRVRLLREKNRRLVEAGNMLLKALEGWGDLFDGLPPSDRKARFAWRALVNSEAKK